MDEVNDYSKAITIALRFLEHCDRLEAEVRSRLHKKGYSEDVTERVIQYLISLNYLNDSRAIQRYVQNGTSYKKQGKHKIYYDLISKGAASSDVQQELENVSHEGQVEGALTLLKKKYDPGDKPDKAARYLFSRGFDSEVVYEALGYFKKDFMIDS